MAGFHLIECLIVLAIIGVLAAFSLPHYSQHIAHSKRVNATQQLLKLALAMEQYHLQHFTYRGATLAELHFSVENLQGSYDFIIAATNDYDFLLQAQPLGKQAEEDKQCKTLTLNAKLEKNITGFGDVKTCW